MNYKYLFPLLFVLFGFSGCSDEIQNEDITQPRENGAMEPDGREPVMSDD